MRRLAPWVVASFMVLAVGCVVEEDGEWLDACGGLCLADEVCYEDAGGAYCDLATYCDLDLCEYDDGGMACVDTYSDPYNCGGCGFYCDGFCSVGVCEGIDYACEDIGLMTCDGYCGNPDSDTDCGACGNWCLVEAGEFCAGGVCATGTCEDAGLTTCSSGCADLLTDPYNCGVCDNECVLGCDGAGNCN